jgi:hypothetical protein
MLAMAAAVYGPMPGSSSQPIADAGSPAEPETALPSL